MFLALPEPAGERGDEWSSAVDATSSHEWRVALTASRTLESSRRRSGRVCCCCCCCCDIDEQKALEIAIALRGNHTFDVAASDTVGCSS
jgi:hypothetical protein